MAQSIITNKEDICYFCERPKECVHHVFYGTANRKLSDKYGLVVPLCNEHHNTSNQGVHFNPTLDLELKKIGQIAFENRYSHKEFMEIFGRNYL